MNRLKNTTDLVKRILEVNEGARNSDMILYVKVCESLNPSVLNKSFWYVIANLKEFNLPSIETVGRCRRKIVETHPELAGNDHVEAQRTVNEEVFREYAKGAV